MEDRQKWDIQGRRSDRSAEACSAFGDPVSGISPRLLRQRFLRNPITASFFSLGGARNRTGLHLLLPKPVANMGRFYRLFLDMTEAGNR